MKKIKKKITIGLPIYNEISNINNVLKNIFSQNLSNFDLIISDNCSNDGTYEVCKKWAKKRVQIRLYRQKKHIMRGHNFLFVYKKCKTKYFTWMAADDSRSVNFLKENVKFLEKNSKFIASCSPCIIADRNGNKKKIKYDLIGENNAKIIKFLNNSFYCHGMIYSVFRYQKFSKLVEVNRYIHYFMWDWMFNIYLVTNGNFKSINKGYLKYSYGGQSSKKEYIRQYSKNFIEL